MPVFDALEFSNGLLVLIGVCAVLTGILHGATGMARIVCTPDRCCWPAAPRSGVCWPGTW